MVAIPSKLLIQGRQRTTVHLVYSLLFIVCINNKVVIQNCLFQVIKCLVYKIYIYIVYVLQKEKRFINKLVQCTLAYIFNIFNHLKPYSKLPKDYHQQLQNFGLWAFYHMMQFYYRCNKNCEYNLIINLIIHFIITFIISIKMHIKYNNYENITFYKLKSSLVT